MKRPTWLMLGALTLSWNISGWEPCALPYSVNPPIVCPSSGCCSWIASLDFLYWRPYVENNAAAQIFTLNNFKSNNDTFHGTTTIVNDCKDFHYDWDSGFRINAGYGFPCDRWSINIAWTHYRTDADFSATGFVKPIIHTDEVEGTVPFPSNMTVSNTYLRGFKGSLLEATWNFQFNQVDLDIAREFYVGCSLSIKPYLGLRTLLVKNHRTVSAVYDQRLFGSVIGTMDNIGLHTRFNPDFKAVGLKAGLDSYYEIMCGLGIYGDINTALLFSEYQVTNTVKQVLTITVLDRRITDDAVSHRYHALRFMTDLSIGLEWRETINACQSLLFFKAGWEHHLIVGGSRYEILSSIETAHNSAYVNAYGNGDISLYGFVVSIGYIF